jgi:hypothetical protein
MAYPALQQPHWGFLNTCTSIAPAAAREPDQALAASPPRRSPANPRRSSFDDIMCITPDQKDCVTGGK